MAEDARLLGLDPALIPSWAAAETEVWADHVAALEAWRAVAGQWRTTMSFNGERSRTLFLGLEATAVRAALDMGGIAATPELWAQLRAIADGAREVLNGR